jgi:hypothetical protein
MKYALFAILALVTTPVLAVVSMSMSGLVDLVVYLIIIGVVFGLLWFLVDRAPFIPEPFKTWIKYVILFVGVLFLINWLLGIAGRPIFTLR